MTLRRLLTGCATILLIAVVIVVVWAFTAGILPPRRQVSTGPETPVVAGVEEASQDKDLARFYKDCEGKLTVVSIDPLTFDCESSVKTVASVEMTTLTRQDTEYSFAGLPNCPYIGTGSSQPLNKDGSIPIVQNGDLWEADLSTNGCALLFEGRIEPGEALHRIIVLRSYNGENAEFVKNGKFTYAEGSIWGYDRTWNMEDFSSKKPPISAEFVNDKRAVMQANDYDWPILVYTTDGQIMDFSPGQEWANVVDNNACEFDQPQMIPVHGQKISGENLFSAAVGALNCTTVAWIDGSKSPEVWQGQRDAENKVVYTTIEAWLMPSDWSETQIADWIAGH
jgi:hypothetical protein